MRRLLSLFVVLTIITFSACKKTQVASRRSLEGKKTEFLLEQIENNKFRFNTFSAKAEVKLKQGEKKQSFKSTVRIKKDSAIWMSITPLLGYEVARVLITKDTVKVINRLKKNYFVGNYAYINKRFNLEFEFELLQSILLGNPIDFESDDKVKFSIDKDKYYLGNLKKRRARKADDKPEVIEKKKDEVLSLWIDPDLFKVVDFLLSDLTADRFVIGKYSDFETYEGQKLPHKLNFEIQAAQPSTVDIDYSKVYLDKAIKFSFNIPSKYEQVYY